MRDAGRRLREFIVHNLLHLDDTPQRIALGVALGFFVAWTPTLGLQMILYVLLATVFRANKVAGLGPVWITNPLTAIPIYYGNWWIGQFILRDAASDQSGDEVRAALTTLGKLAANMQFRDATFWKAMGRALGALGYELWFGSCVVGLVLGGISYFVSLRAVVAYRRRRAEHEAAHPAPATPSDGGVL